eukprot:6200401-Pyramimonas_sp.AAC.1
MLAKRNPRPQMGAAWFRRVISDLPEKKTPGVYRLSEKDVQRLPPLGLQQLADFYSLVEKDVYWPRQALVALVTLQVKDQDPDRALGPMAW